MAEPKNTSSGHIAGNHNATTNDLAVLHDKLDTLFIRYLDLVDQYQYAQKDVQKHLSSAFFSLAQANFKSPHRRLYGRDFYDERMKASHLYHFQSEHDGSVKLSFNSHASDVHAKDSGSEEQQQPQQEPSPPATPEPEGEQRADDRDAKKNAKHEVDEQAAKSPPDPIRWFGILVPQELRRAQASFTSVLAGSGSEVCDGAVAKAANAARAMRSLEIEIGRCRKGIRKIEERKGRNSG